MRGWTQTWQESVDDVRLTWDGLRLKAWSNLHPPAAGEVGLRRTKFVGPKSEIPQWIKWAMYHVGKGMRCLLCNAGMVFRGVFALYQIRCEMSDMKEEITGSERSLHHVMFPVRLSGVAITTIALNNTRDI
jgi:hypothetical protein